MTDHQEPEIVVNGQKLTPAEAMTVRVAMSSFLMSLQSADALGDDHHGRAMKALYSRHCRSIVEKMKGAK